MGYVPILTTIAFYAIAATAVVVLLRSMHRETPPR